MRRDHHDDHCLVNGYRELIQIGRHWNTCIKIFLVIFSISLIIESSCNLQTFSDTTFQVSA